MSPKPLGAILLAISALVVSVSAQNITSKDLLDGLANPSRWLTHSGDYTGQLFQFQTGAAIYAPPTTYAIDGRQYVVIPSGATLTSFALPKRPST